MGCLAPILPIAKHPATPQLVCNPHDYWETQTAHSEQSMTQLLEGSTFWLTNSACHIMTANKLLLGVLSKLLCYPHNSTNPAQRHAQSAHAAAYNISMRPSSTAETRE
jgi:hypothetical protein